jgi:predicted HD phosphohydrolase
MSNDASEERAKFHQMTDGTQDDWMVIVKNAMAFNQKLPERVLAHLNLLRGDYGGFAVDRLEHSLQTATRAHRDGRDEEYVACALIHDIGDTLGSLNHADIGAAILKPFVSEQNLFMLENHGIFQGYYFFQFLGLDQNMRDRFKENPWYGYTAEFCELYDQNSFDPSYDSMPLEAFEPLLKSVMQKPRRSIYLSS